MTREILLQRAKVPIGILTITGILPSVAASLLLLTPEWFMAAFASAIAARAAYGLWRWTDGR